MKSHKMEINLLGRFVGSLSIIFATISTRSLLSFTYRYSTISFITVTFFKRSSSVLFPLQNSSSTVWLHYCKSQKMHLPLQKFIESPSKWIDIHIMGILNSKLHFWRHIFACTLEIALGINQKRYQQRMKRCLLLPLIIQNRLLR
jgi:hypothetical protein